MPTPPTIRLRPVQPADLPAIFLAQLDPDSNRMAVVNPRSQDDFNTHWAKVLGNPTITAHAILCINDHNQPNDHAPNQPAEHPAEQLAGHISCFPIENEHNIGYWIHKPFWGQGIASRALALLLQSLPHRPLHARAATSNPASIRVLQKCGFQLLRTEHAPATDRFPACEEAVFILTADHQSPTA